MLEHRWISQQVSQPDFRMHTSACNMRWSRGQKETDNRSVILAVAVPVAAALSHGPLICFHWLDCLQSPPFPSEDCHRGTSAPFVLLNTTAVFQRSQQQFKMRKRVSSQTQK